MRGLKIISQFSEDGELLYLKWVGRGGMKPTGLWNVRGRGGGAWGDLRGGVSKYFNNEHVEKSTYESYLGTCNTQY